jgi:hypothetical protein
MLKMLLAPEGATIGELLEAGISRSATRTAIITLCDQKGWDIRSFPCPIDRRLYYGGNGKTLVYKVVGKMRWDGSYRPIGKAEIIEPNYNEGEDE